MYPMCKNHKEEKELCEMMGTSTAMASSVYNKHIKFNHCID